MAPVVGVVTLVGIVAILAATVSVTTLALADGVSEPAPTVSASGSLDARVPSGPDQVVRLVHVAGEPVSVRALELVVDATDSCGKRSRIVGVPTTTLGPPNYQGADIFDYFSPDGGQLEPSADGVWSAGERLRFRLAEHECGVAAGDELHVRVVHRPSGAVIVETVVAAS